jgi:hypothetical protein
MSSLLFKDSIIKLRIVPNSNPIAFCIFEHEAQEFFFCSSNQMTILEQCADFSFQYLKADLCLVESKPLHLFLFKVIDFEDKLRLVVVIIVGMKVV